MNLCIFRTINNCKICCFKTKNKYCNLHINNDNIIYEIIYLAIGNEQIKNTNDIYKIFKYIYNDPNIYVKELIFKKILETLFVKYQILRKIYNYLKYDIYNKQILIDRIFKLNYNTFKIEKDLINKNKYIEIIKRFFKFILIKPHIYNNNLNYINESDPFTFDLITDIPIKYRFIFNNDNNYYCFRANEFKYFLRNIGFWNPYNKIVINYKIIKNLNYFIDYFKINKFNNNNWSTVEQAFTDVSIIIEKIGFYTNTQWFLKLIPKQIMNIMRLFNLISNSSISYFNDYNEDYDNIYYYFAKEIIRLFQDGNSNFLLCCNFMKSIAVYSNDFYNSLPEWLSDINTPIIINNSISRTTDILYLINIIEN